MIKKYMQPRIWAYSIFLAFSWLPYPVMTIAGETANFTEKSASAHNIVASSPASTAKPIAVNKVEFGVLRREKSGKITFIPTTKVPLQQGTAYGWRLHLKNYHGKVTWREVFQLPKPPESWATMNTENFSISPDGKLAETKRTDSAKNGVITNSWTIAPGDPLGKHKIEIYISDRRVATFEFEVVPLIRQKPTAKV